MGSVKDLTVLVPPTEMEAGRGVFEFSDRYSVFDWGEMPDHIPEKGSSLCLISAYFFELFEKAGLKTHYIGLEQNGEVLSLSSISKPSNRMHVRLFRVIHPEKKGNVYDYSRFKELDRNYLIPLEVIYRFSLPDGSSVFRRLESGQLKPSDLGLSAPPEPGTVLEKPFVDFSTKLEPYDRYLSREEAFQISGLSDKLFKEMVEMTVEAASMIWERYSAIGLVNDDGKFEFALDESGDLVIIDAVGTPDECRISYNNVKLSKELARYFYRDTAWHKEVEEAKKTFGSDWRSHVTSQPHRLNTEQAKVLSNIYRTITNEVTGIRFFDDAPSIAQLIQDIKEIIDAG